MEVAILLALYFWHENCFIYSWV